LFHTIREKVKDPSNTFDVIHVEHLRGARYGLALREVFFGTEGRPGMVWDSVDCISLLFHLAAAHSKRALTRWVARFELPRTKRFERSLLEKFDRVLVTSDVDKQELHLLANGRPIAPIHVLPNGVDGGFFRSDEQPPREALTIIMTGKMSYHANVTMAVHFIEDILPLIRTRIPQVKVWIVGQNPTREVVRLARDPAVTVTGTVPDLRPFLARAALAVTPIAYGVGIQNKVLEAMACATPVVATPQALRGIGARPGLEVMAAEAPELFADQVIGLLTDPQRRRSLGEAGRQYVSSHHQWPTIAGQLEGIYDESRSHR
jgi:glycosyltransferase involved in cell wall biosynthesis